MFICGQINILWQFFVPDYGLICLLSINEPGFSDHILIRVHHNTQENIEHEILFQMPRLAPLTLPVMNSSRGGYKDQIGELFSFLSCN